MKNYIGKTLLIVCLLAGVGVVTAKAQIYSDTTVEADIPYAFIVGTTTLPAGKYTIRTLDDTSLNLLEIRSSNGRAAAAFETQSNLAERTPLQTELVFNKIGDQYFLSQIWVAGSDSGAQVEKSKMERGLEAGGSNSERHSVASQIVENDKASQKRRLTGAVATALNGRLRSPGQELQVSVSLPAAP
jgi:hypothetical protein